MVGRSLKYDFIYTNNVTVVIGKYKLYKSHILINFTTKAFRPCQMDTCVLSHWSLPTNYKGRSWNYFAFKILTMVFPLWTLSSPNSQGLFSLSYQNPHALPCSQSFFSLLVSPVSLTFIMLSIFTPFHLTNAKPYMSSLPRPFPSIYCLKRVKISCWLRPVNSLGSSYSSVILLLLSIWMLTKFPRAIIPNLLVTVFKPRIPSSF